MGLARRDYRIHSCLNKTGNRRHVLNLDSGKVTNGTGIYTTLPDGTREQIWQYMGPLYTEAKDDASRNTKCITFNNETHLAEISDVDANRREYDQAVKAIPVDESQNIYRIKLSRRDLYLTTNKATGIGTCFFKELDENNEGQKWIFEPVVRVTGMPETGTYINNIEFFSTCTGWQNLSFLRQERKVADRIINLYQAVSKKPDVLSDSACLYNFPGAIAYGQGNLNGYFHYGVDMVFDGNVYPYKDGTFWGTSPRDGAVGIKHSFPQGDCVFWYLHMTDILNQKELEFQKGDFVSADTRIGQVGTTGGVPKHLHIEAQPLKIIDSEGNVAKSMPRNPRDNKIYLKAVDGNYFGAYDLLDFIEEA